MIFERLTAWLLMAANTCPPYLEKERFYVIKKRLLRRYAQDIGSEWQRIVHYCWACDATGVYADTGEDCHRCDGGIYQQFWVPLTVWEWEGFLFHSPGDRTWFEPDAEIKYQGKIQKQRHYFSHEAVLWLFLIFDQKAFLRMLRYNRQSMFSRYPLSALQWIVFEVWHRSLTAQRRLFNAFQGWKNRQGTDIDDMPF